MRLSKERRHVETNVRTIVRRNGNAGGVVVRRSVGDVHKVLGIVIHCKPHKRTNVSRERPWACWLEYERTSNVHVSRLEHGCHLTNGRLGIELAVVLLHQRAHARIGARLHMLVNVHEIRQLGMAGPRRRVDVVPHVDGLVRISDRHEAVGLIADSDKDRARSMGILSNAVE